MTTPNKVSFTCTIDDYAAAQRLHRRPAKGQAPGIGERLLFLWILLAVIVVLFGAAIAQGVASGISGAPRSPRGEGVITWIIELAAAWAPWLLIFGLIWFFVSPPMTPMNRAPLRRLLLFLASVPLLIRLVELAIDGPTSPQAPPAPAPAPGQASDDQSTWRALLPWAIVMVGVWIFVFRYLRGLTPRMWAAQPHMSLPQTLESSDGGLVFADETSRCDYRWSAFTKWRESDQLFLLYLSDLYFQIVPKRAFATPAELEMFRRLLEAHVPCADVTARGFAVAVATPAPTVGPLPPPPLPDATATATATTASSAASSSQSSS